MTSKEHTQEANNSLRDLHSPCTVYRVQETSTHTLYTKDGLKHRVDGPAMIAGDKEWFYIDGYLKTPKEHATYKELYNNYENDPIYTSMGVDIKAEELYYLMASESTTSIYTLSTTSI